jgi:thiamine biosynthesis lipoprotein
VNGYKNIPVYIQIIILLLLMPGCSREKISVTRPLLGTIVNITVNGDKKTAVEAINSAFTEIERIQALFSSYSDKTDIARLNRDGGQSMVELTPEVFKLLKLSALISSKTSGSFDVTFASLG